MRILITILIIIIGFFFQSFNSTSFYIYQSNNTSYACDSIPELNKQVIDFVTANIKKKVGRGECWDLAAEALKLINASWDGKYKYGREVFFQNECIYPGDIIQFEGVIVKYKKGDVSYKEEMAHHTAIIYEVKGMGDFILAHQNTEFSGKKVGLSPLELKNITKGKYKIYRPTK